MAAIELTLPDMTCEHCVRTITKTVQEVDTSATVAVDLASHRVRIESPLPVPYFTDALAEQGYPAAA
jgi:copper chaperone